MDNEIVDYLLYAKIGPNPFEFIYDTTSTTLPISYEEFATSAFEQFPMLPRILSHSNWKRPMELIP